MKDVISAKQISTIFQSVKVYTFHTTAYFFNIKTRKTTYCFINFVCIFPDAIVTIPINVTECNCNPKGVVAGFAGCDKVEPGELCTCKTHVTGRICDQCKSTYWDLQYHHEDGCVQCDCNLAGTLSGLNECSIEEGQCNCKRHVVGRRCDKCADGFFQLEVHNQFGCQGKSLAYYLLIIVFCTLSFNKQRFEKIIENR